MADRYWSREEVEALIPTLTGIMEPVMKAHVAAGEVRERIRQEQQRITMSGGGMIDREAWQADRHALARLTAEIRAGLARVVTLGGVPKDLSLGLVDFLHLRDGREVNLCWEYGEREIRFWHGLDEGYASRKPLEGGSA